MNGPKVKLVILDEATSALDTMTEIEVIKRFRDVAKKRGQTLIVVTHRLSSLVEYAELTMYVCLFSYFLCIWLKSNYEVA